MKTAIRVALAALLGSGVSLLILGAIIWTTDAEGLIGLHIALGVVLVLSLWTITAIASGSGVAGGTVAFAGAWGALVVVLGLAQEELVPGTWHWTIQILHVAISMGAIWWGRHLVHLIQQRQTSRQLGSPPRGTVSTSPSTTSGR